MAQSNLEYPKVVVDHALHAGSATLIAGTMAGVLPPIAAILAICWYLVQLWESKTVQGWVKRHKR